MCCIVSYYPSFQEEVREEKAVYEKSWVLWELTEPQHIAFRVRDYLLLV